MGFVSTRLAPRKRPCTNIIVYQCRAIVGPASVSDAPASCQIRLQRQECYYPLAFTAPTPPLVWPQAPFIIGQQLLQWPSRRLTLWLTAGGPAMPEPGQGSRRWWSEGIVLVWRPAQGCWLWDLTLTHSPPVGSGLELRRPRSPAENRGWAAIHWAWTRSCVRLSTDHWGPSRSGRPGSCCWPQIRQWKQPHSLGKAFCFGDMCEKSQLAGIRLHSVVMAQFIILIRLLVFSLIPHIHKGVRSSTTHAELTLRKSRWWFPNITHATTYIHNGRTWILPTFTCRKKKLHSNTNTDSPEDPQWGSMYGQVSDLMRSLRMMDETGWLLYPFVVSDHSSNHWLSADCVCVCVYRILLRTMLHACYAGFLCIKARSFPFQKKWGSYPKNWQNYFFCLLF